MHIDHSLCLYCTGIRIAFGGALKLKRYQGYVRGLHTAFVHLAGLLRNFVWGDFDQVIFSGEWFFLVLLDYLGVSAFFRENDTWNFGFNGWEDRYKGA